ncbi:ABC transporter ATP-binding protein [Candidatus Peribacteria bacterium]|nr:ABC transporter ATP-binding protein [Candidatus Peribacteria bacterium]
MTLLLVENLSKSFGGVRAVDGLSFTVRPGSITGLIGPNGAGKTTAFNLITHFVPAESGQILYQGEDLRRVPAHRIVRKGIARTFQQIRLFRNLTVRENLLLACSHTYDGWWSSFSPVDEDLHLERLTALLEEVGLQDYLDHSAAELSYGQSKLVEILRCVLQDADLILLDEPAAGVNPTLLRTVERLIRRLNRDGKTLLIIEHHMPFLMRIADEVVVMENGRFLMQDTPEKVQTDPRVLEAYLGA